MRQKRLGFRKIYDKMVKVFRCCSIPFILVVPTISTGQAFANSAYVANGGDSVSVIDTAT